MQCFAQRRVVGIAVGPVLAILAAFAHPAFAQTPAAPVNPAAAMVPGPYGAPVSLGDAKKAGAVALAEAQKLNVPMVIAITDISGELIYFERMDGAIAGGVHVAQQKATTAAIYKRPTKVFEDAIAQGGIGMRFLRLDRVVPIEGGHPIVQNGRLVGAIGVSGGTGVQDGIVARAAADAIK
jgi:glc operon protein GlcG